LLSSYLSWLEGRPLAARSRQAYARQVRRYLAWLGDRSPLDGDPLDDGTPLTGRPGGQLALAGGS
jgi:hypothetical protein